MRLNRSLTILGVSLITLTSCGNKATPGIVTPGEGEIAIKDIYTKSIGEKVKVSGMVSYRLDASSYTEGFYIVDNKTSAVAYIYGSDDEHEVKVGNIVTIEGEISDYFDAKQIRFKSLVANDEQEHTFVPESYTELSLSDAQKIGRKENPNSKAYRAKLKVEKNDSIEPNRYTYLFRDIENSEAVAIHYTKQSSKDLTKYQQYVGQSIDCIYSIAGYDGSNNCRIIIHEILD